MRITIFDFDDTLYASTEDSQNGIPEFKLISLRKSIKKLIEIYAELSDAVYIITNANLEWVRICGTFLDIPFLELTGVEVISTRHCGIADVHPIENWKKVAFRDLLDNFFMDFPPPGNAEVSKEQKISKQIIAFGDSPFDRDALLHARDSYPGVLTKNISMIIHPKVDQLIAQHNVLFETAKKIIEFDNHIDLILCNNEMLKSEESPLPKYDCINHSAFKKYMDDLNAEKNKETDKDVVMQI